MKPWDIQSISYLDRDEELAAIKDYQKTKNPSVLDKIIRANANFIGSLSRKYTRSNIDQEDMFQLSVEGFIKGVLKYDTKNHSVSLRTFATYHVRAVVLDYITSNSLVSKITTKDSRKLFFNSNLFASDRKSLTDAQLQHIADEMDVSLEKVKDMEKRLVNGYLSYDSPLSDSENFDDFSIFGESIPDDRYSVDTMIEASHRDLMMEDIQNALISLDDRSRHIIETRWMCDKEDKLTLYDLSDIHNVSPERIRQIESVGIKKIKSQVDLSLAA